MKALDLGLIIIEAEMQLEVPGSLRPVADLWGTILSEVLSSGDSAMKIKATGQ